MSTIYIVGKLVIAHSVLSALGICSRGMIQEIAQSEGPVHNSEFMNRSFYLNDSEHLLMRRF